MRFPVRLLVVSVLLVSVSALPVFLVGSSIVPMGRELGFGVSGLGALAAAFFLTSSVTSAPLGRLVQRLGWRTALTVGASASAFVLVGIAGLVRSVWTLAIALVVAGAFYGMANPAANLALAEHVDPTRRALTFGLKHAGIPLASLLAGLAVPVVVVDLGWRWAFALGAVLAPVCVALARRVPEAVTDHAQRDDPRRPAIRLERGALGALAVAAGLATVAALALGGFTVAAAVDRGVDVAAAGWLLFAGSAASIAGRVVAGWLTDRAGGRGFAAAAAVMAIGAGVFVGLMFASGGWFAALVLAAFATGWAWPGLMTFIVVNANRTTAATSSGVTQAGVFVGAGLGPIGVGLLAERASFAAVWAVVAVASMAAAAIVMVVGRSAGPVPR